MPLDEPDISQETRKGAEIHLAQIDGSEIHRSESSMEDWDADVSPCIFATAHIPAERKGAALYLPITSAFTLNV